MADLDDFFAKKDRKKKKQPTNEIRPTDLLKVLENAAQNVTAEDFADDGNHNVQLGPVLAEVVNSEEASKWQEPIEEDDEIHVDLSGLKIESLAPNEEEEEEKSRAEKEAIKPAKGWGVIQQPIKKEETIVASLPPAVVEEKIETPASVDSLLEKAKELAKPVQETIPEPTPAVAPAASSAGGSYVPPHLRNKATSTPAGPAPTPAAQPQPQPAPAVSAPASGGAAYIPPSVRRKMEEEARAAETASRPSTNAYSGPGALRGPTRKPELNNEEEFPTLGGGKR